MEQALKMDWSATDHPTLLRLINDFYTEDQKLKLKLSRQWEENIRFIEGEQYIRYNATSRNYEPIPSRVDREFIPRANDNQLYVRYEILRANLTRQPPRWNVEPNSNDPIDQRKSKVAEAVHDTRMELDNDDVINADCADWAVATGNAFKKVAWEPYKKIPVIQPDGKCAYNPDGTILEAPVGDVCITSRSPLNMALDLKYTDVDSGEVIMEYSAQLVSDVKQWYSVNGDGYTGEALSLGSEEIKDGICLKILDDLKYPVGESKDFLKERVILKEVYVKPREGFPNGRMIVSANGKILYDWISPYAAINKKKWHPYKHFKYMTQAGSPWGTTPITQCVRLQRRLNAIDTMTILHRQTMALGQWLIPQNSIPDGMISGRVGLKVIYRETPGGNKPEKINGTMLGQDVFKERELVVMAMDRICGTTEIMQGQQPGSIESNVSLEFIREMSFSRFTPMYLRWEKFNEDFAQSRLQLIAKKQTLDVPFFTSQLKNRLRKLTAQDIATFVGADLADNTNIRVEAQSTIPQSTAAKLASLQKFGEAGLLGDLVQDPFRNQLFLSAFNIDDFKTELNIHFEKAKYNLSLIESGQERQLQVNPRDNGEIHIQYFLSKLLDPEWYPSQRPEVLKSAWKYVDYFEKLKDRKTKDAQKASRAERDENAYVQSLVNSGGPEGNPPSLELFPTVLQERVEENKQSGEPVMQ